MVETITLFGNEKVYFIHGVMMWASWGWCGFIIFLSNRWWSYKSDWVQAPHSLAALVVFWMTIGSFIHMVSATGFDLGDFHQIIGFIMLFLVTMSQVGGVVTYRSKQSLTWNTAKAIENKKYHGTTGTVTLILSVIVISSGLFKFTS